MTSAYVEILAETTNGKLNEWRLCFQYCRYVFQGDDPRDEYGYRFIWRRPNGHLQPARGQARIPSLADIQELTNKALDEGWGNHKGL